MEGKLTDQNREKYNREIEEWKHLYPFTAAVLFGNRKVKNEEVMELIKLGEERRAINS